MVARVDSKVEIADVTASDLATTAFDIGVWAAGYEKRSAWLISSRYRPLSVADWIRIEFEEDRAAHSAQETLGVKVGRLPNGGPGKRDWDGDWLSTWLRELRSAREKRDRTIDVFVDYSSMPRTVYGTLVMACMRSGYVRSLTLSYTPGDHAPEVNGSRRLDGLRPLVGLEGLPRHDREPAFVIGLGYDGCLSRALVEVFQIGHFSVLYGDPSVVDGGVERARRVNEALLDRAERVATAPAWSIGGSYLATKALCDWYLPRRDVVVIALGPKPHVIGTLLVSMLNPQVGFRWIKTGQSRPVEVTVPDSAVPFVSRLESRSIPG